MMLSHVVVSLVLAQYVRTRVDDRDPQSQCLWWNDTSTITFRQNSDGNSQTPGETEFSAATKAFDTWTAALGCSSLQLREGPRTSTRSVGYVQTSATNENVVVYRLRACAGSVASNDACWTDDNCGNLHDCWQHGDAAIGITTTSFEEQTGRILDADIELNSVSFVFSTVDSPPCPFRGYSTSCVATDVQNTLTHEVGHALGLAHSTSGGSTMAARADPGELSKRVLDPESKQFLCDVYPKGRPARTCVVKTVDQTLGKRAPGCSASGTEFLGLGGLVLLLLRGRRQRRNWW